MKCPFCSAETRPDTLICDYCGSTVVDTKPGAPDCICQTCHHENPPLALKCERCGTKMLKGREFKEYQNIKIEFNNLRMTIASKFPPPSPEEIDSLVSPLRQRLQKLDYPQTFIDEHVASLKKR